MAFSDETYGVLMKKIKAFLTGIGDVKAIPPNKLEFTNVNTNNKFIVTLPMNMTQDELDWLKLMSVNLLENPDTGKLEYKGVAIESTITENIKATVNCGAVASGEIVSKDLNLTGFAKRLLQKDLAPSVTITSTEDSTIVYEKGIDLTTTLTITAKKINTGDNDITKVVLQATPENVAYDYTDNSPNVSTNTYTKTVTINSTTSFKGTATNAKNLAGSKTVTFTFVNLIYIGSVSEALDELTVSETDIKDNSSKILVNIIPSANKYTETMTVDMKKIIIAYDKTLGELKEINDVTNKTNTISAFTKFEINMTMEDGTVLPYYCYIGKVRSKITDKDMQFVW